MQVQESGNGSFARARISARRLAALASICWLFITVSSGGAEPLRLESGVSQTAMIELYTSEGCSSCPPAEAYLNRYVTLPDLWTRYVPMAFHVDYWDSLGWKDRFALPANTDRQKSYARQRRNHTIYTPALFVNGEAMQPRSLGTPVAPKTQPVGNLSAILDGHEIQARFDPVDNSVVAKELHVAILGMGLSTQIEAGENQGRRSRHEFVVLRHDVVSTPGNSWQTTLPQVDRGRAKRMAVAIWISEADDPTPLQAAGAFLPWPAK